MTTQYYVACQSRQPDSQSFKMTHTVGSAIDAVKWKEYYELQWGAHYTYHVECE